MRILFSSTEGLGHIQPMLPLALKLRERGHHVLWATADPGRTRIAAEGIETVAAGISQADRQTEYERRWPESAALTGEALAAHFFPRSFGILDAPAMFGDLLPIARSWQPDIIVTDAAEFAAPVVARALRLPLVTHGFGLVVPPQRVQATVDETEHLWAAIGEVAPPFGGFYELLYIDIYPRSLQPEDLIRVGRIQSMRPTSITRITGEVPSARVQAAIADGRPLIYLTFGTLFNVNDAFRSAVEALGLLSDVVVLVTVGPTGDVDAFGPQPGHVTVERYIAQSELLGHVAVVVSHGGSGTMLGALAEGIPLVVLPQAADQLRNASAAARAGAGIALFEGETSVDAVRTAILTALTDVGVRAAAQRLQSEIAAMPTVDDAAMAIERLRSG